LSYRDGDFYYCDGGIPVAAAIPLFDFLILRPSVLRMVGEREEIKATSV
jgi:hypothetical protein